MKKIEPTDPIAQSTDIVSNNIKQLYDLFPEAIAEGKVDFDVLKQLLGAKVDDREEKYGINWYGKRTARQLALTPSTGTLRPSPADSVDWDTTNNIIIEGDNLESLKLLQRAFASKAKMIYIDPPYNTGHDFVYPDDFRDSIKNYLTITGQAEDGKRLTTNVEASGRFHTEWLNLMYPRLKLARNLLRNDGAIFITIDDNEVAHLRLLCDEIFGQENCLGVLVWQHSLQPKGYSGTFSVHHNFVLCYQKTSDFELANLDRTDEHNKNYSNPDNDPNGAWRAGDVRNAAYRPNLIFDIQTPSGKKIPPPQNGWRWSKDTIQKKIESGEIVFSPDESRIIRKIYLQGLDGRTPETILFGKDVGTTRDAASELKALFDDVVPFDTPKPTALIRHLMALAGIQGGDLVVDFFAGSGTTGEAVMAQSVETGKNCRFILVQLPEPLDAEKKEQRSAIELCDKLGLKRNIAELTKERLRRVGKHAKAKGVSPACDLGFRVLKLASSNIHAWDPNRDNIPETLDQAVEHLKKDRSEQDILFELLLKLGLDLTVPIETKVIADKSVHSIGAGVLLACLADKIDSKDVEPLALGIAEWHKALATAGESQVVFRDSAFADDVAKTNITAILQQHGLETVRSL